jgi:hypothetical protein
MIDQKGWARPGNANKWHYFNDEITSLCRRWMFVSEHAEDESDDHPDNCVECRRKKKRLDEKPVVDKSDINDHT